MIWAVFVQVDGRWEFYTEPELFPEHVASAFPRIFPTLAAPDCELCLWTLERIEQVTREYKTGDLSPVLS